jgi:enoyl-CoA hydratase/carnithine racemase
VGAVSSLLVDRPVEGVLRLRLHREERRNAIDRSTVEALLKAFESVDARAVILGSASGTAFCSGIDVTMSEAERVIVSDLLYELYERMIGCPVPIVAVVSGSAIGAGAQLCVASDLRIASTGARIRFVGPGHGLVVGAWGLPSLVGRGRALDLFLSMQWLQADEAFRLGLFDRVSDEPMEAALAFAASLATVDPGVLERAKRVILAGSSDLRAALLEERRGNRAWTGSLPTEQ